MDKSNKRKTITAVAGAPNPIVIQKIDVRPFNRTTQDIPGWRRAVQSAEARSPRRTLLYDLYADVVQDGHVIAVTGKRFDAATTANWQFINKDGKPVDVINDIIDSTGFDEIVAEIVNSKFWGYSILEPIFFKGYNEKWEVEANLLPRLNYRPELGVVAFESTGEEGINIREGIYAKTIMEVGKTTDLGLLLSAAQYAILKRGGVGDYAMFVQVFGRPIIDATWDGFDEGQRQKLLASLDIGPGGVIVRPDGTTVTILESKTTNTTIHPDFLKILNKEISKALLGTTETVESSDSSGYAQSKTHSDQDNNKHESDINFVRKVLNSRFTKILEAHGFNTEGGSFIIQGEETKLSTKESFEMHKAMVKDLALPIDDDFFYETYGIPKPDNYDILKKERQEISKKTEPFTIPIGEKSTKSGQKKEEKDPEAKEVKLKWLKRFTQLFQSAPAETTGATCGSHHIINLSLEDNFNDEALIQRVFDAKGSFTFEADLFEYTLKTLLKGFKKGWDHQIISLQYAPGFEYNIDDPALLTAFEQNLFRFTGAKNLAEIQMLNELFKKSKSFDEFYRLAKAQTTIFNKDWLLTEYNTAILTGESAATYHRLMAQVDIFPYWKYTTAGDDHVRLTHQFLDGIILPANDERWDKIFPPNGWNCRCYVVPILRSEFDKNNITVNKAKVDAYLTSPEFAKEEAQGWGVNRGKIGQIFIANQQYIHKFPDMASKLLNELGASEFGLPSYSNAKKTALTNLPSFEKTNDAFLKELELFNEKPIVRDYHNRPITIDRKNFIRHTDGKADDRTKLLTAMQETLQKPDEVWMNGDTLEDLVYIKYYKGQTFITIIDVKANQTKLSTWFTMYEKKDVITKYRRGLLVYGKIKP